MNFLKIATLSVIMLLTYGCAYAPVSGLITTAKWDGQFSDTNTNILKTGTSCAQSVLGVVAFGDASIEAAKRDAGITKVTTVDHETLNVLYFYGRYCTIVYGE